MVVAGALALVQIVAFAGVRSELPVFSALSTGGRPFLIQRIPNGATIGQRIDVQAKDLMSVDVSGEVTGRAQSGFVDAALVEETRDAGEIVVRTASVRVVDTCCAFAFESVPDSWGKQYRLDLRFRDFESSAPLSLWAVPVDNGGLTINGRPQAARLTFEGSAGGHTALDRLRRRSPRPMHLPVPGLLALLIALDVAVACGAAGLVRAFWKVR